MILDIHSHRTAPYPEGIVSLMIGGERQKGETSLIEGQFYSAGIHPWSMAENGVSEAEIGKLRDLSARQDVVAVGECGIDIPKGGALYRQLQAFKAQVEISETVKKPLILHCVKASDIILGLKKDLRPVQPWIIHGFRGKPALGRQLVNAGLYLSFGEKFNPDTVRMTPREMLFAETDESPLSIEEIIKNLSESAGMDLTAQIAENIRALLKIG